ncbi:DNA polymerase III subunit gamma and tau [Dactylosporangium sp. NPDC048998]|uniref:DNA polymerase III subunit gamma and tau n=1 Tax=Dactylosporangium sp. NPDC048998 TaxID=3363976 RepID=UPI003717D38D
MALALYRKYRPRTFAEVIGQEHVTEPLSQALRSGRLNHAYLFSGPRGCGKTSSARILARSLNCERGPTPEPCGECQSCRDLAPGGAGSIDVIEIDAASHGGVDDARDLRERAFFAPVSSRFKVYVIDEAHMVSSAGFNALLKLVEEPPEYVKFVFATTEPEKVLGTIKSRTHHYPFRLIPPGVLRPYLEHLTAAEGVKVEPAVFPLVVRAGAGSARDTLSVLDQLIAGAGEEGVSYARAVALLGVTDAALIDEMCDALAADDGRGAYGVIDRVVEAGHDPRRFASDLLERLRDLIVLQQVPDAVTKGLLDAPHDQLERMGAQATQLGQATLSRYADIVHNGLTEMRGTTAPRLLLELITARMLLPGADDSSTALLQRLERMERRLLAGGVAAAAPAAAPPSAMAPAVAPVEAAPAATDAPPVRGAVDGGNRGLDYIRDPRGGGSAAPVASPPEAPSAWSDVAPAPAPVAAPPPAQPAAAAPAPVAPAPAPSAAPAPGATGGGLDADAIRRIWPDLLALVNDKSKKTGAIIREAMVQDVEGATLVLGFKYSTHAEMLNASPDVLLSALQELVGGRWQVRCEVGGQPGGGGGGNRPTPPKPTPQPSGPPAPSPSPSGPVQAASGPHQGSAPQHGTPQHGAPQQVGSQHGAHQRADAPMQHREGSHQQRDGSFQQGAAVGGGFGRSGGGPAAAGSSFAAPSSTTTSGSVSATAVVQEEDWPAPAIPGGAAAQVDAAASGTGPMPTGAASAAEDWPTPVTPGGGAAMAGGGSASPAQSAGATAAGAMAAGSMAAGPGAAGRTGAGVTAAGPMAEGAPTAAVPAWSGGGMPNAAQPNGPAFNGSAPNGPAISGAAASGVGIGGAAAGGVGLGGAAANGHAIGGAAATGAGIGGAASGGATAPSSARAAATGNQGGFESAAPVANPVAAHGSTTASMTTTARGGAPARPRQGGSSALEKAREAASRAAAAAANGGRRGGGSAATPAARATAAPGAAGAVAIESAWEGTGADEPPFDPEYDSPVADPRFPGLDPGDELLDDATEVRETSEEAALRLLIEAFGAEKIGETTGG